MELEHGACDRETDVTLAGLLLTGKMAWAHLMEIRDHYPRLGRLDAGAKGQT